MMSHDECPDGDVHVGGIWKGGLPLNDDVGGMGATFIVFPHAPSPSPVTLLITSANFSSNSKLFHPFRLSP